MSPLGADDDGDLCLSLQVWEFSSLCSPVDRWSFGNTPSMADHLKTCCFYQREQRTEPVALNCLGELTNMEGWNR